MLANKAAVDFLRPFASLIRRFCAVPINGYEHYSPDALCAIGRKTFELENVQSHFDVEAAVASFSDLRADDLPILICGSLYLAGEVLHRNGQMPD